MTTKTKLKNLKYEVPGVESNRPGLELAVPLIFILFVLPMGMIFIGLVLMYRDRIDDIPPSWQLGLSCLALAYPVYLGIKRFWKRVILKQ